MRSNITKEQAYRTAFGLLVNGHIPDYLLTGYLNDKDGQGTMNLQHWIVENMRGEIYDWCTGIGIIEAVEHLVKTSVENGNVKFEL